MKNDWLAKGLTWILLYGLGAAVFLWTASLTTAFVGSVLPNSDFAPYFALVLFDGGVLGWMYIFMSLAKGTGQRITSIAMLIADFLGLAAISIAEVFLGGQNLVAAPELLAEISVWVLGIWTLINVAGFVIFHVSDPNNMEKIQKQLAEDKIIAMSLQKLMDKTDAISDQVADALAERKKVEMLERLSAKGDVDVRSPKIKVETHQQLPSETHSNNGKVVEEPNFTKR